MEHCLFIIYVLFIVLNCVISYTSCESTVNEKSITLGITGRQLFENGRTLVHNTVKRFMVILPAIFFKLGIAFTLLILVTIVSGMNGFIGFMLLVVGLSSVLARLQGDTRRSATVPISYTHPLPPYHHFIERTDKNVNNEPKHGDEQQYNPQSLQYYTRYQNSKI